MALENGGIPPSAIEVVRRTHTRKDGTFIYKQAEAHVAEAEELARQRLEGSGVTDPTQQQLDDAYVEIAMNPKGHVYGLGSVQLVDVTANESAAATLRRNVNVELRLDDVENNIAELKNDNAETKRAMAALLRVNGIDPVTLQQVPRDDSGEAASCPTPGSHSEGFPPQVNL